MIKVETISANVLRFLGQGMTGTDAMRVVLRRLVVGATDLDGGDPARRRQSAKDRPISGTRLIREFQGIGHCVTVRDENFEYQGRPYKSLSAIARAITGTRWNDLIFFGLKNQRAAR